MTEGTDQTEREFEGDRISGSRIVVTKAGDGLSDSLKVDPVTLHKGDLVYFVLRGRVRKVGFPPARVDKGEPSDDVVREHTIDTVDIAIVDEAAVAKMLETERERVERGLASMKGQLKTGDPEPHKFAPSDGDPTECWECEAGPDAPWHSDEHRDAKRDDE